MGPCCSPFNSGNPPNFHTPQHFSRGDRVLGNPLVPGTAVRGQTSPVWGQTAGHRSACPTASSRQRHPKGTGDPGWPRGMAGVPVRVTAGAAGTLPVRGRWPGHGGGGGACRGCRAFLACRVHLVRIPASGSRPRSTPAGP